MRLILIVVYLFWCVCIEAVGRNGFDFNPSVSYK